MADYDECDSPTSTGQAPREWTLECESDGFHWWPIKYPSGTPGESVPVVEKAWADARIAELEQGIEALENAQLYEKGRAENFRQRAFEAESEVARLREELERVGALYELAKGELAAAGDLQKNTEVYAGNAEAALASAREEAEQYRAALADICTALALDPDEALAQIDEVSNAALSSSPTTEEK